jgi:sporulation protein YlmC with PRC-barrel domain
MSFRDRSPPECANRETYRRGAGTEWTATHLVWAILPKISAGTGHDRRNVHRTERRVSKQRKTEPMKRLLLATALTLLASTASFAAEPAATMTRSSDTLMTTIPGDGVTVTNWYKQNVYDSSNNKIGEIEDVLVDKSGKITAVIISVGGFLGMDTKDVAAPFQAIHTTMKDNKWWLTMNTTRETLKSAPGYRYDKNTTMWVADKS